MDAAWTLMIERITEAAAPNPVFAATFAGAVGGSFILTVQTARLSLRVSDVSRARAHGDRVHGPYESSRTAAAMSSGMGASIGVPPTTSRSAWSGVLARTGSEPLAPGLKSAAESGVFRPYW